MTLAVYTGCMAAASVLRFEQPGAHHMRSRTWKLFFKWVIAGLCLLLGVTTARELHAETATAIDSEHEQAANLFEAAEAAFAAEDYERAARLFERANDKAPHASVAYNAAVSWDYAKQRARAADAYQLALTLVNLDPAQTTQAEQRLAELGLQLGYVHIAKPVGGIASVGRIERQPIPLRFYQEPGAYTVELETADGDTTVTEIVVVGGQTLRVELNPVARAAPTAEASPASPMPAPTSTPTPVREDPDQTQEVLGWVGLGIGVAAAGAAAYLGYQVWRNRTAYLEGGRLDTGRYNEHETLRTRTNVAWAASGAAGVLGATLLLTSPTFEF